MSKIGAQEIRLDHYIRVNELLDGLQEKLTLDEIVDVVKHIDDDMDSEEFTRKVYNYFKAEVKKWDDC